MSVSNTKCECGHEKRDHTFPLIGTQGYGKCKVCLCDRYVKLQAHVEDETGVTVKVGGPA